MSHFTIQTQVLSKPSTTWIQVCAYGNEKAIVTCCVPGTMVIQMKNQTVDIKALIYQNIQCINILAQTPETSHVMFVCMTMSRSKIIYNLFYNC